MMITLAVMTDILKRIGIILSDDIFLTKSTIDIRKTTAILVVVVIRLTNLNQRAARVDGLCQVQNKNILMAENPYVPTVFERVNYITRLRAPSRGTNSRCPDHW